jgi:hypothetical protein
MGHMLVGWLTRSDASVTSNGIPILHAITVWDCQVVTCYHVLRSRLHGGNFVL